MQGHRPAGADRTADLEVHLRPVTRAIVRSCDSAGCIDTSPCERPHHAKQGPIMDIAAPTPDPTKRRAWLWIALAGALVAVLGFGAYLALGRDSGPTLTAAEQKCNDGRTDARLGDGDKTLIINTSGDPIKSIIDVQTVACVLDYL